MIAVQRFAGVTLRVGSPTPRDHGPRVFRGMTFAQPLRILTALVVLLVSGNTHSSAAEPLTIRVAPNGDDAKPAGPFATPARALRAVRELRAANGGKLPGSVTIELAAGTYRLAEPLVLTPEDSGTAEAPVVWTAAPGAKVVLSGGVPLAGWREGELNGRKVWVTKGPGGEFRSLWVGDER